ncbi:MAG: hypothetical protein ACR2RD_02385 [Woeseiaceae bacterium]
MDPEKKNVVEELDRITASEDFRGKPLMRKLLRYLVTESIEGRSKQIKGYSIGVDVFGQGSGFDPNKGALVRNNALRLRALLKTYYLGEGGKDPLVIEIPKGKYVPAFRTNNSARHDVPGIEDATTRVTRDTDTRLPPAVAVLPFRNLTNDPALAYVATGFSRDLTDTLTKFEFRVIGIGARNEVDAAGYEEVIRARGINFLIDGDVAALGSQVKIKFRLINVEDDSQLWGDSVRFNVEEDDLFDILERVTRRVASTIGGEYGHLNQYRYQVMLQSRPQSPTEQDMLLKHYHLAAVLTDDSLAEFHRDLLEALQREPESAVLNALAAGFYLTVWAFSGDEADDALQEFARLAEKAYDLNPNHQAVLSTISGKCLMFDEKDRFLGLFEQSKGWMPNSPLRLGAWAMHMCLFGEWERGKELLDQVFENNLYVPMWLYGPSCLYYFRLHEYETALVEANKFQIPGLFWGPAYRTALLGHLGRLPEAEKEFKDLLECRPGFRENGRLLMGRYIREPDLLEHVLEGFEKIGVTIA